VAIGGDVTGATITAGSSGDCPKSTQCHARDWSGPSRWTARAEDRPPVQAREGSVSIGGNVSNSMIGVPYEKLKEAVRLRTNDLEDLSASEKETVALSKEKLDFNPRQVKSALEIVSEATVRSPRTARGEARQDRRKIQGPLNGGGATRRRHENNRVEAEAQKAIQDGQLGKEDDVLAAIKKTQTEALALNAAQTTA
jgi:hypothetical protein